MSGHIDRTFDYTIIIIIIEFVVCLEQLKNTETNKNDNKNNFICYVSGERQIYNEQLNDNKNKTKTRALAATSD